MSYSTQEEELAKLTPEQLERVRKTLWQYMKEPTKSLLQESFEKDQSL